MPVLTVRLLLSSLLVLSSVPAEVLAAVAAVSVVLGSVVLGSSVLGSVAAALAVVALEPEAKLSSVVVGTLADAIAEVHAPLRSPTLLFLALHDGLLDPEMYVAERRLVMP